MVFVCDSCGKTVDVPEAMAGRRGRCPKCTKIVTFPLLGPTPAVPKADTDGQDDSDVFHLSDLRPSSAYETNIYPAIHVGDADDESKPAEPLPPLGRALPASRLSRNCWLIVITLLLISGAIIAMVVKLC